MILAGDIGGTHTRLAFFEVEGKSLRIVVEAIVASHDYANLDVIVSKFTADHPCNVTQACIGVAGSVVHGRCEATNLPWVVDAQVLSRALNLPTVGLINDLEAKDPPTVITQAALAGRSALCESVLEQFICLYGAEAGNLALKMRATGGVFIGGGIAPKIIEKLKGTGTFMSAFIAKGRMRSLLETIPVQVILNDKAALLGAAFWASTQASKATDPRA